jgi:cellobiose phosphorylase
MMMKKQQLKNNQGIYFPLMNQKGLKGFITPFFAGHLAIDHDHYVLEPTSERNLYHQTSRNVMFFINDIRHDLNGLLKHQQDTTFTYETGLSYQKVTREVDQIIIETTSFLVSETNVERHHIKVVNHHDFPVTFQAISAVELYGRSAENQRDHRHVTSLLNVTEIHPQVVLMQPTLHFDETGHHLNSYAYGVSFQMIGHENLGASPTLDRFIGEGSLLYPKGLDDIVSSGTFYGYETIASFQTEVITLQPNEEKNIMLAIGVDKNKENLKQSLIDALDYHSFELELKRSERFYQPYINDLSFQLISKEVSHRLQFVSLQPLFRRVMGNSYLPHHDYGKGGRGWRDLWQDLIALNMYYDPQVYEMLYQYFKGIRLDGSNATIIGDQPGSFKADRNAIARVWSDHGAWPFITLLMYIHETGDLAFLMRKQAYFSDHLYGYGKFKTQDKPGFTAYQGTILEHILIQHIVALHHVGAHGYIKLMDADWNDGLDMGHEHGETIAFTMMYVNNINALIELIERLDVETFELYEPIQHVILNTISLDEYFQTREIKVSVITKVDLVNALKKLYERHLKHLQKAYVDDVYQSYYDHQGNLLDDSNTVMLTGQAMALLNKIATQDQAIKLAKKTKQKLYQKHLGGYQLNSLYQKEKQPLGRAFYFAYGHKENGAVFSHMVMMYAYGLYQYNLKHDGREAWLTVLEQAMKSNSQVYEGIPEYFNDQGKGKYLYLTGSASWLLYLLRHQVFGLKFKFGKLYLEPQLTRQDFIDQLATIDTKTFGNHTTIHYHLETDSDDYHIKKIIADNQNITLPIEKHYKIIHVYIGDKNGL